MLPIFLLTINNSTDRSFAESLYDQHKDKIYKITYKILKNQQDAEDATSETFIKIINNIQSYYNKSENELTSIFIAIAKNTAIDKYRKINKIDFVPVPEDYNDKNDFEDEVIDFVINKELYEKLHKAIDMLDIEYSEIIKLKMGYSYSDIEIGKILNISTANVKIRYYRAKKILLGYLKGERQNG